MQASAVVAEEADARFSASAKPKAASASTSESKAPGSARGVKRGRSTLVEDSGICASSATAQVGADLIYIVVI